MTSQLHFGTLEMNDSPNQGTEPVHTVSNQTPRIRNLADSFRGRISVIALTALASFGVSGCSEDKQGHPTQQAAVDLRPDGVPESAQLMNREVVHKMYQSLEDVVFPQSEVVISDSMIQFDGKDPYEFHYDHQDFNAPVGPLMADDGISVVGEYEFLTLPNTSQRLLKILVFSPLSGYPDDQHFFLVDGGGAEFTRVTSCRGYTDAGVLQDERLAPLLLDPLGMNPQERSDALHQMITSRVQPYVNDHSYYDRLFSLVFSRTLIDIRNKLHNGQDLSLDDFTFFSDLFDGGFSRFSSSEVRELVMSFALDELNPLLPLRLRNKIMESFFRLDGNGEMTSTKAHLIMRYLDQAQNDYAGQSQQEIDERRRTTEVALMSSLKVLSHLLVDASVKQQLVSRLMISFSNKPSYSAALTFINKAILQDDDLFLDTDPYLPIVHQYINDLLAERAPSIQQGLGSQIRIPELLHIYQQFQHIIHPAHWQTLEQGILFTLSRANTRPLFENELRLLLGTTDFPLSPSLLNQMENFLIHYGWQSLSPVNITEIIRTWHFLFDLSISPSQRVLQQILPQIVQQFQAAGNAGVSREDIYQLVTLVKRTDSSLLQDLDPLITLMNPQSASETNLEYSTRILDLLDIWNQREIFICDEDGNYPHVAGFSTSIRDYSRIQPDALDVLALIDAPNGIPTGYGFSGSFEFLITGNVPVESMKYLIVHEGAHGRDLANRPFDLLLDSSKDSFFSGGSDFDLAFTSNYAASNPDEDFAENTSSILLNTQDSLNHAINAWQKGEDKLLNQMLFIWMDLKASSPAGMLPLGTGDQNPIFSQTFVEAGFINGGNSKNGVFYFQLNGKDYYVVYDGYVITAVYSS